MTENYIPSAFPAAEAERHVAGCLLVDPRGVLAEVQGIVSASDFADGLCRSIFEVTSRLCSDPAASIDPVIVQAELAKSGLTVESRTLADLMALAPTTANASLHAEIVHNAAVQRQAASIGMSLASASLSISDAIGQLQELQSSGTRELIPPSELIQQFADYFEDAASGKVKQFLSTWYTDLDRVLGGGLVRAGLITLAARPGAGKTSVAVNIAQRITAHGGTVLYFSLEMPTAQIQARRAGIISGLPFKSFLDGQIAEKDWGRVNDAFCQMAREPFNIYDKPVTIEDIERLVRSCQGVEAVFIDHIGLIRTEKGFSRYEAVTGITHRLKQLALSVGVPIVALCQLNRNCEARDSKLPSVADLRDSGAIEEDSDVVALLFREAMYLPEDEKPKSWETQTLEVIVEKNRHAPQGSALFDFCGVNARVTGRKYD